MARFILRFGGASTTTAEDIERILSSTTITVVDSSPRMLLVEADAETLAAVVRTIPGWKMFEEQTVPLPDTRKKLGS